MVGVALDDQERPQQDHRGGAGTDHPRIGPAARRALGEHQHTGGTGQGGQQCAGDVELEPFVAGLLETGERDRDDEDADGQVDQERQPPRDHGQRTAEHQAEHRPDALHGRRDGHGPVAGMPDGVGGGDQRQPGRGGDGGADALYRAGGDEQRPVGGQAAGGRGDGEDADAGDERPLVSDRVADAPAEQQQAAEGQHVGGDHPALAGVGQMQVGLHARQRDHHDGAVQGGHQLHAGDRDDRDPEYAGGKRSGSG